MEEIKKKAFQRIIYAKEILHTKGKELSENKEDYFFEEFASGFDQEQKYWLREFLGNDLEIEKFKPKTKYLIMMEEQIQNIEDWKDFENKITKMAVEMSYMWLMQSIKNMYKL